METTSDIKPREDERKMHADASLSKRSNDSMTSDLIILRFAFVCQSDIKSKLPWRNYDVTMQNIYKAYDMSRRYCTDMKMETWGDS